MILILYNSNCNKYVAIIFSINREKREEKKAAQDDEYHIKRMESLK